MRKASDIILLVGAIISIVCVLVFLIIGIIMTLAGQLSTEEIIKAMNEGKYTTDVPGTPEEKAAAIKAILTGTGIFFLVVAVLGVVNAVLGFVARVKKSTPLYVANIVFGVLSLTEVTLVGGIFGLIANGQEASKPAVSE